MSLTPKGVENYLEALNELFRSGNLLGPRLAQNYVELAEDPYQDHIDVLWAKWNEVSPFVDPELMEKVTKAVATKLNF